MKKKPLALAAYRSVVAANDDGSSAPSEDPSSPPPYLPLAGPSGRDPFEVWRTRIRVVVRRGPPGKR